MIKFRCSKCNHKIGSPDNFAGKVVRCPSCKELTFVPPTVDEVEAALAAAHTELTQVTDTPSPPTAPDVALPPVSPELLPPPVPIIEKLPPSDAVDVPASPKIKPHEYRWLKYLASMYIAFGAVATLLCFIWMVIQLRESMSAQSQGRTYTAQEIFGACFWVVGGIIATTTLFTTGQALLAFRDMVENSWITREVAARQRATNRS